MLTIPMLAEGAFLLSLSLGVGSHLIFKRIEPTSLWILTILLGLVPAIPPLVLSAKNSLSAFAPAYLVYYGALLSSIAVYRLSPLHPLYKYPGPIQCRLSKLWLTYIASSGKLYLYFQELHEKYGPIVRVGPNELSIIEVDLIPSILGADGMPKGPLWDGRRIAGRRGAAFKDRRGNLIGARDKQQHVQTRRIWNRAFTTSAIKGYEPIIARRAEEMVEGMLRIAKQGDGKGQTDLAEWMSFFAFDFMGDVVFGRSFNLLRDGDRTGLWHTLESGLYLPALTEQIPWCADLVVRLPFVGREMKALGELAFRYSSVRREEGPTQQDLFYHLLGEDDNDPDRLPFPMMVTNAVTAIIAGSDTTATTLSNIFYFLLANPDCYLRLREEVDAAYPRGEGPPIDPVKLAGLQYMNAVINEALRLLPPVISCLQRAPNPGSGGHMIGSNLYISEDTAVFVPPYALLRDPHYFSPNPNKFWPERWLLANQDPSIVLNTSAFIPFSTGPANCIGKPLAMVELRVIVAYLVQTFEMRFASGYDPKSWENDICDYFVVRKGILPVVLTSRL